MTPLKAEITHDELLALPPLKKRILHGHEEIIDVQVSTYSIEEIIAEKLRALQGCPIKTLNKLSG